MTNKNRKFLITLIALSSLFSSLAFAVQPKELKYRDLHEFSWIFEAKTKVLEVAILKEHILEKAYKNGVIEFQSSEEPNYYKIAENLTSNEFIEILKHKKFREDYYTLFEQIIKLENELSEFLIYWKRSHYGIPSWLSNIKTLEGVYKNDPRRFKMLSKNYLKIDHEKSDLKFENVSKNEALAFLNWEPGLFTWLIPIGLRYGEEKEPEPSALNEMRLGFSEILRQQMVPMKTQLLFFDLLERLIEDPKRLKNFEFTKKIWNQIGMDNFVSFNSFFNGFMREQSRLLAKAILKWNQSASGLKASQFYQVIKSKSCEEIIIPPKTNEPK